MLTPHQARPEWMDDENLLVAEMQAGNQDAFCHLVRTHETAVFHHCLKMTGDGSLSEDLTQETFLKVLRSIHSYQCNYKIISWIYRIATNASIDQLRRRTRHNHVVSLCEVGEGRAAPQLAREYEVPDERNLPDACLENAELRERIIIAVGNLSEILRETFLLRELENMSYEEIAERQDSNVGTVKSRLFRARRELREQLSL